MIDSTKQGMAIAPSSGSASSSLLTESPTSLRIMGCDGKAESTVPIWAPLSFLAASAARHAGQSEAAARSVATAVTSGGQFISKSYKPPKSAKQAKEDVVYQIMMASQEASSAMRKSGANSDAVVAMNEDIERAGMLLAKMVHSGLVIRLSRFGSGYHIETRDPRDEEDSRDDIEMARSSGSTWKDRGIIDVSSDDNLFVRDTLMRGKPKSKEEIKPKKVPSDQSESTDKFFEDVMSGLEEAANEKGLRKKIPVKRVDNNKLKAKNKRQDAPDENPPEKSKSETNLKTSQEIASNENDDVAPVALRNTRSDDATVKRSNQEAKRWRAAIDEKSGKTYYYRKDTKEVLWEKPPWFDDVRKPRGSRSSRKSDDDPTPKRSSSVKIKGEKSACAFEELLAIHGLVQYCSRHLASSDGDDPRASSPAPSMVSTTTSTVILDRARGLLMDEISQLDEKRKKRSLYGRMTQRFGK